MGLQFEIAGNQIDGARDYQEDAFLVTHLTDAEGQPGALVIVADGMGGHAAGNVASNMAVQAINKYISSNYPAEDITGLLQGGVLKANASIAETIRETPALQGMGCTMVAILIEQDRLWWASVGDSHLYLLRDKELTKKNADHSYGGFLDRLAAAGQPMEPEPGLSRNMLMSAITGEEITEIDCPEEPFQLQAGDRLLLCSDGLDTLSSGKIIQFAEWSARPKEYVQALLDAVEEAAMPRQDNTTAIVIDIFSKEGVAAEAPPEVTPAKELEDATEGFETTAEMEVVESAGDDTASGTAAEPEFEPEPEVEPGPPPAPEPSPATAESRPDTARGARGGLMAAAAVVLIAIIGGAAYFLIQPSDEASETTIAEVPAPAPAPEPAEPETIPEQPATETEPEPALAEKEPPAPTETAEVPATEAPAAAGPVETFSDHLKSGGQGPIMVTIPAGAFRMGSSRFSEERPEHEVTVDRFAISQHEITIAEYERFARATGNPVPDTMGLSKQDHPVINVSWPQAVKYTDWLSRQTGHNYRLPTEAEWEYAASAGRDTDYWWGVTMQPGHAHCFGCNDGPPPGAPTAVGSFPANPFGLHDTEGNVAEWVQDCWHRDYEGAPETAAVAWTEGGDCNLRVVRGGSWSSPPTSLRNARRDKFDADGQYDNIGFRVVREVD